jgi:hypothetical protein
MKDIVKHCTCSKDSTAKEGMVIGGESTLKAVTLMAEESRL